MTEATIWLRTSNARRAKLKTKELIRQIASDSDTKVRRTFHSNFINSFLSLQHAAFLQKAQTGGDEWNDSWLSLSQKTIDDKKRRKVDHPEWINVRTGRLLAAFEPLTEAGGRLYMRKDMQVSIAGSVISFVVAIPYSDRVDSVRPLFVLAEELISRAAEKALVDTLKTVLPSEGF